MKVTIQRAGKNSAPSVFALINESRDHLLPWLPEIGGMESQEEVEEFLSTYEDTDFFQGKEIYEIRLGSELAGLASLHHGDVSTDEVQIGYWLGKSFTGRGIATRASAILIDRVFEHTFIKTILIKCLKTNTASRNIPRRLGFQKTGLETEIATGKRVIVYEMPKAQWLHDPNASRLWGIPNIKLKIALPVFARRSRKSLTLQRHAI